MIKFDNVTLIDNYRLINEKVHFIKSNLSFEEGIVHLIKGNNSKYLIGKLLMGFITPSFGKIIVDNFTVIHNRFPRNLKQMRKKIGYIPYDFDWMFNYKTVNNNLKEILYNYKYEIEIADEKCKRILEKVGLFGDYKIAKMNELSSINRYRLYLASVLIHDPDIIIIERYINDPDIKKLLFELAHEHKKTVILIGNYKIKADKLWQLSNNELKEVEYGD